MPPPGPDDHVRGPQDAPLLIVYTDFECPYCALVEARLRVRRARVVFRHFPKRSRSWALAAAAEAAARQGAFWPFHDALVGDQGHLDDPHLWARAEKLGLDLDRFQVDRRDPEIQARVRAQFRGGLRAGVVATPTIVLDARRWSGRPPQSYWDALAPA